MSFFSIAGAGAAKTLMAVTVSLHPGAAHQSSHHATVQAGDSLSSIAQRELGKAADWPALWWVNRHTVHNPSLIQAGQKLVVPNSPEVKPWLMRAALAAIPAPRPGAGAGRPGGLLGPGCGAGPGCSGQQRVLQRRVGQLPELRDPGGERRGRGRRSTPPAARAACTASCRPPGRRSATPGCRRTRRSPSRTRPSRRSTPSRARRPGLPTTGAESAQLTSGAPGLTGPGLLAFPGAQCDLPHTLPIPPGVAAVLSSGMQMTQGGMHP